MQPYKCWFDERNGSSRGKTKMKSYKKILVKISEFPTLDETLERKDL